MTYPDDTYTTGFQRELYPGNCNAAGVPLVGQKGEHAVINYVNIISQMTPLERANFDELRETQQALLDAEQGKEENLVRTKANPTSLRLSRVCRRRTQRILSSLRRAKRSRGNVFHRTPSHLHAHRYPVVQFRMKMREENGLHLDLHIGSVLIGIAISAVCAAWKPQIAPMLRRLRVNP